MVEKKKEINLREADYSDRLIFDDIKIQDEIVERAHARAPNTVTLGTVGLIGGAYLGGHVYFASGARLYSYRVETQLGNPKNLRLK